MDNHLNKKTTDIIRRSVQMVQKRRFELPRVAALPPEDSVSAIPPLLHNLLLHHTPKFFNRLVLIV